MTERSGIEIDYCPECRGIWLDRGELDKIIERSAQNTKDFQNDNQYNKPRYPTDRDYPYKRKKGLLGELFDF
jgi:Zn-finger nucleic acid-binding protein